MSFVFPPPAPAEDPVADSASYGIGSSLAISWTGTNSTWSNATLVLMKNDNNYTCSLLNLGAAYCQAIQPSFSAADSHGFSWRISTYDYPQYPADSNPFYYLIMGAFDTSGVVAKFYSHGFFIYPQDSVPSLTYGASTASSTTAISTSDSSSTATTTTSSSSSPPSLMSSSTSSSTATAASSSGGLDTGTKVATGVAVGLGVPLTIALVFIAFHFYKKRQKKSHSTDRAPGTLSPGNEMRGPSELASGRTPMPTQYSWQSLKTQPHLSELSGDGHTLR
ncbi:hypothetical protein RBB50_001880 [Rhinocladiella similis]